jgi:Protein of unknown function (DUF2815)
MKIEASRKGTSMMTGIVRLAFVNALVAKPNPSGALKYSVTLLIEPNDPMIPMMKEAIKEAAVEKWADKIPKGLRNPIRDGNEKEYAGFAGHLFVSCNSDNKPGVVDAAAKPITEEKHIYSGCWARVDINFFGYHKAGNQGVACGLNNIQVLGDDDAFTGRQDASKVFSAVVSADNPFESKADKAVDADVEDMFA